MWGLDVLGFPKYQKLCINEWPDGWACGVFAETFGDPFPGLENLLATGRCPRVRVHGPWTDHKYIPKLHDKAIFRALKQCAALKAKFPNTDIQFSPVCESDARGEAWRNLFERIGLQNNGVKIVCSINKGERIDWPIGETHGPSKPMGGRYNYSFDGTSSVDSDVQAFKNLHAAAETFYFWHPAFNGKYKTKDGPPNDSRPPKLRESWPVPELLDSIIWLHKPSGDVKIPKDFICKSHADRHKTPPEARAYKPVYITPPNVKPNLLELVCDNGQILAISSKPEPFNDKVNGKLLGWRYYFPQYGYSLSEKAIRIHGKPIVTLRGAGKVLGMINPAYRAGNFR